MAENRIRRRKTSYSGARSRSPETVDIENDIPDMPDENKAAPRRSGMRVAERDRTKGSRELPVRSASSKSKKKRLNYRMMLLYALFGAGLIALLFFALFMNQRGKNKDLTKQVDDLTTQNNTLNDQINALSEEAEGLRQGIMSTLPDAKNSDEDDLQDLISQLTDGSYVIKAGSGYDYIKVPSGYFTDKLNSYKNADGYTAIEGSAPTCSYYVVYPDRVVGLSEGDKGFVSNDRKATGTGSNLPSGFTSFVTSMFSSTGNSDSDSSDSDSSDENPDSGNSDDNSGSDSNDGDSDNSDE